MLKKTLLAAALLGAAAGLARPASADLKFVEPYGAIFSARPFLTSPEDARPKDALQSQASRVENPRRRFLVTPFFATTDSGDGLIDLDTDFWGLGLGYASVTDPAHPWSLNVSAFNTDIGGRIGPFDFDFDFLTIDFLGKLVLWQSENVREPVISGVVRYQLAFEDVEDRFDLALALDQRISPSLFLTANVGYADRSEDDIVAGFGATWRPGFMRNLSISADYTVDNDVDGEDFWTVSALYAFGNTSSVRIGGGKHTTFFANYIAKFDMR